jgi:hypothetical protein
MAMRVFLGTLMLTAVSAVSAAAQDVKPSTALCMNSGNEYKVGEYACISACHGARRLARCDAVAQTASWTYVSDACPSAMAPPSIMESCAKPVVTAMSPSLLPIERRMSEMSPAAWMHLEEVRKKQHLALVTN